jgi:hypothetical protein
MQVNKFMVGAPHTSSATPVRVMKIATGKFVADVTETEKENALKVD